MKNEYDRRGLAAIAGANPDVSRIALWGVIHKAAGGDGFRAVREPCARGGPAIIGEGGAEIAAATDY